MKTDLILQNKKLELIQWLSGLNDITVIDKITEIRNQGTKDWWHTISEPEQLSIEQGIEEAESEKLNAHSDVRKIYEKWL